MTAKKAIEFLRMHFEYLKERWKPYPDYNVLEAIRFAISAIEKQIPKKPIMKQYFENLEEQYLCCPKCGEILTDRQTDRQADRLALTEQSISRSKEKLQTVSRQDMTAEYQTCGQMETLLLKGMVDKNIEPTASVIDVSAAIMSRDYKGPNNYGMNGVIEWKY
jgi:hypothetical protein